MPRGEFAGDQLIDRPQEGGKGLAAAGRRRDQDVLARRDALPALLLDVRRLADLAAKPALDDWMEAGQCAHLWFVSDGVAGDVAASFPETRV